VKTIGILFSNNNNRISFLCTHAAAAEGIVTGRRMLDIGCEKVKVVL
jgi:hypothetical protein